MKTVPHTIVRPFTVYGRNARGDMLFYRWINQIKAHQPVTVFGDGETRRGYTHVDDVVRGTLLALQHPEDDDFNLGGDKVVSLNDILRLYRTVVPGLEVDNQPQPAGDVLENFADIAKAKKRLSWEPERNFSTELINILQDELGST